MLWEQKGLSAMHWEDDGDGNVALLPENDEEATVLTMMANAYDRQAATRSDDNFVRIILNGPSNALPHQFDGLIFGIDERGVQGFIPSHRQGFWVDWVAMDMTAMIEFRMRACAGKEGR